MRRILPGIAVFLAAAAAAQAPVIAEMNFYGLHEVTVGQLTGVLGLKSGDPIPPSKGALEDLLEQVPGVDNARVEAVCCEGPRVALFIGIAEPGAPRATFRPAPTGNATLPQPLLDAYSQNDRPPLAALAAGHLDQLRDVLRNGSEPEQRAFAAALIGYAPRKAEIADDLAYALGDPDDSVRANALHAISDAAIRVPAAPLIELLNSLALTDRVEATRLLLSLTDAGEGEALGQIRAGALPALVEMARWKTPRYALPPFLLLGRVAGVGDAELHQLWDKGERETVIRKAQMPR